MEDALRAILAEIQAACDDEGGDMRPDKVLGYIMGLSFAAETLLDR